MADTSRLIRDMVARLTRAGGDDLLSVVLYGVRAHGDYATDPDHVYLLVVMRDLRLETVASIGDPIRWWRKHDKPWPRLMCPESIREAADVFPIELLDITAHHEVLHGDDPFGELDVQSDHLRLQCERELREKMMRLQEGYVETAGKTKAVRTLMVESYLTFANIFRGCLHLHGDTVPVHTIDAVRLFCERAGIDAEPFEAIDALLRGRAGSSEVAETFASYYKQLQRAVGAIDRFQADKQGDPK